MTEPNPYRKQFEEMRESYRDLQKLVWSVQKDFHEFKEKIGKSSGANAKGRFRVSAQWAQAIGVILAVIVSIYVLIGDHRTEDFNLRVDSRIDAKLGPSSTKQNELVDRVSKIEGKIDALLAMKHIDALGGLVKKRDGAGAMREADGALAHLAEATLSRAPIPQEYFRESSSVISRAVLESKGQLPITDKLHKVSMALAEYSSAIQPQPDLSGPQKAIDTSIHAAVQMRINVKLLLGAYICPVYVHGDVFESPAPYRLDNNVVIDGPAVFVGMVPDASQTLDGTHWLGVTFVNMRIRYKGGEVELQNVRFINCTFEFSNDPRAVEFALTLTSLGRKRSVWAVWTGLILAGILPSGHSGWVHLEDRWMLAMLQ